MLQDGNFANPSWYFFDYDEETEDWTLRDELPDTPRREGLIHYDSAVYGAEVQANSPEAAFEKAKELKRKFC